VLTRRWLLWGCAIVAAAGIPVLSAGYGADPDAWLVASVAGRLWSDGSYAVSRFPGYPLHEIVSAPLVGLGGCTLSNAGTLVAALVLTWLWYRISGKLGKNPRLLFLSLICSPLILSNAATTMDYVWSLAFLLAAFDAALERKEIASGILTGLAAGFRPSNLSLALALWTLVTLGGTRRVGLRYIIAAGASACAAFLPVLVTYGGPLRWFALTRAEMGDVHPEFGARVLEFGYRSVYAAGPLAFIILILAAITGRESLREAVREKDPVIVASLVAIAVMAIQFFALPLERSYLLPALPFVLLVADRCSSPRMSLALLICIASMNLVNFDIIGHRRSGDVVAPGVHEGRLQESWSDRLAMMEIQRTLHRENK
jgi:hypothetical protein